MAAGFSRRTLLTAVPATLLAARRALGFGELSHFIPAVAQYSGKWDARLSGLRRLSAELQRRTSAEGVADTRPFPLSSPKLFEYPFLYFGGNRRFLPRCPRRTSRRTYGDT